MPDSYEDLGEVYRKGMWFALHERLTANPERDINLRVWHKYGSSEIIVSRVDPDELSDLIKLLQQVQSEFKP